MSGHLLFLTFVVFTSCPLEPWALSTSSAPQESSSLLSAAGQSCSSSMPSGLPLDQGVAGPVAELKWFVPKNNEGSGDGNDGGGWSEPVVAAHIMVCGDLYWYEDPPPGRNLVSMSSWRGRKHRFDLVRGTTVATRHSPTVFELESAGGRKLEITTHGVEESDFWLRRVGLFTKGWSDLLEATSLVVAPSPRPSVIYDVSSLPPTTTSTSSSKGVNVASANKIFKAADSVRQAVEKGLNAAAQSLPEASEAGITDLLKTAPLVGVGFAVIGYGLDVAQRYADESSALPQAMEFALELSEQCMEELVSVEALRRYGATTWTNHDEKRRGRVISALDELEVAIRVLNELQRNGGRKRLLDVWFSRQGKASKILSVTLESCRSKLNDQQTHSSLMGIDLIRTMLNKVYEKVDTEAKSASDEILNSVQRIEVSMYDLVDAVVQSGKYTSVVMSNELLGRIRSCREIDDFLEVYDSKPFQQSLRRLQIEQGGKDPEDWAKEWAMRMRDGDDEAEILNDDRKACLLLLYVLCNQWKDERSSVSESDIVNVFQDYRVSNILQVCLVMDRAQALYRMQYLGASNYGMHWVAGRDIERSDYWKQKMKECGGMPTIDEKILWLMDVTGLKLKQNKKLMEWVEPKEALWSERT